MINSYKGEFTVVPWAMEMSFFNCSHGCRYCFANLAKVDRKWDVKAVARQITNASNLSQKNISNFLLANKFITLVSNRVDPFSHNNHKYALNFIEMAHQLDMPLTYQTKGGYGINEVLQHEKKEHWYISIPMIDEKKAKEHEPNAPSIAQRLELIDQLKEAGQDVCIGINPTWSEFINKDELAQLCEILASKGVKGVAFNKLHFGSKQRQNMGARAKSYYFDDKGKFKKDENSILFDYSKIAYDYGLEPYFVGFPYRSDYFTEALKLYGSASMPIMQDFINMLYDNNQEPVTIVFNDLLEFFEHKILKYKFNDCHSYIFQPDMGRWIENKMEQKMFKSLRDVLKVYWNFHEFSKSLLKFDCFWIHGDENKVEKDENGNIILVFDPLYLKNYEL